MPINYGSQIDEHNNVRTDAGMFDVSHMTVVDLTGERTREFLRYLLANNVDRLTESGCVRRMAPEGDRVRYLRALVGDQAPDGGAAGDGGGIVGLGRPHLGPVAQQLGQAFACLLARHGQIARRRRWRLRVLARRPVDAGRLDLPGRL